MRRTKEEAALTRKTIVKTALAVFSEKGYGGTRLADIAKLAGVTRGAIYHHFDSKGELYLAVFELWGILDPVVEQAIAEGGTWQQQFQRVMCRTLELVENDPDFQAMLELSFNKPEVSEAERDWFIKGQQMKQTEIRKALDDIADFIRAGLAAGEVRDDLDPEVGAQAYIGYFNGLALLWLVDKGMFSLKQNAAVLADMLTRAFVKS